MLSHSQIVDKLLHFENNPALLDYKFCYDNILIWPFVRYQLFHYVIFRELNYQKAHASTERTSLKERFVTIFSSLFLSPVFAPRKYQIVFLNWTSNTTGVKIGRKYSNKRDDYFGKIFLNDTVFLEQSVKGKFRYPRAHPNVLNRDIISFLSKISRKIHKVRNSDIETVMKFFDFIESNFPYSLPKSYLKSLERKVLKQSGQFTIQKQLYQRLIKRISPKIVFVQNSTYGHYGYLVKWIKELGIRTAEFQHGTIYKGHMGYNFGDSLVRNPEYIRYLPDYLLTFGDYWNTQTNSSSMKISIGNPHLITKLENTPDIRTNKKMKIILIISQGPVSSSLVNFTIDLSKLLLLHHSYKIIYRLHPGEVAFKDRYERLNAYPNIELNETGDIYTLFPISEYIIGYTSTALYEAAVFNKAIFLLQIDGAESYIPQDIGTRIKDANDFYRRLQEPVEEHKVKSMYYWNPDWIINYSNFMTKVIGVE